jgi:hypothetical protein
MPRLAPDHRALEKCSTKTWHGRQSRYQAGVAESVVIHGICECLAPPIRIRVDKIKTRYRPFREKLDTAISYDHEEGHHQDSNSPFWGRCTPSWLSHDAVLPMDVEVPA